MEAVTTAQVLVSLVLIVSFVGFIFYRQKLANNRPKTGGGSNSSDNELTDKPSFRP